MDKRRSIKFVQSNDRLLNYLEHNDYSKRGWKPVVSGLCGEPRIEETSGHGKAMTTSRILDIKEWVSLNLFDMHSKDLGCDPSVMRVC